MQLILMCFIILADYNFNVHRCMDDKEHHERPEYNYLDYIVSKSVQAYLTVMFL